MTIPVKQVISTKFIEVQIEENLNWMQHVTLTDK